MPSRSRKTKTTKPRKTAKSSKSTKPTKQLTIDDYIRVIEEGSRSIGPIRVQAARPINTTDVAYAIAEAIQPVAPIARRLESAGDDELARATEKYKLASAHLLKAINRKAELHDFHELGLIVNPKLISQKKYGNDVRRVPRKHQTVRERIHGDPHNAGEVINLELRRTNKKIEAGGDGHDAAVSELYDFYRYFGGRGKPDIKEMNDHLQSVIRKHYRFYGPSYGQRNIEEIRVKQKRRDSVKTERDILARAHEDPSLWDSKDVKIRSVLDKYKTRSEEWTLTDEQVNGKLKYYHAGTPLVPKSIDITADLDEYRSSFEKIIGNIMKREGSVYVGLAASFSRQNPDFGHFTEVNHISDAQQHNMDMVEFNAGHFQDALDILTKRLSEEFASVEKLYDYTSEVFLNELRMVVARRPAAGGKWLPGVNDLPKRISNSHGVVQMKNKNDNMCFFYAILRARHMVERDKGRVGDLRDLLNQFGHWTADRQRFMDIDDVGLFVSEFPDYPVNVYGLRRVPGDDPDAWQLDIMFRTECVQNPINLLLYKGHYNLITNISAATKQSRTSKVKVGICHRCLQTVRKGKYATVEIAVAMHEQKCVFELNNHTMNMIMNEFTGIYFKNQRACFEMPFVVYYDIESILETDRADDWVHSSEMISIQAKHTFGSAAVYVAVKPQYTHLMKNTIYKIKAGPNAGSQFIDLLFDLESKFNDILKTNIKMLPLDKKQQKYHDETDKCIICDKIILEAPPDELRDPEKNDFYIQLEKNKKVRDHDHFTGEYRGPAHQKCNLYARKATFVPCIAHNARGYDQKHLMRQLIETGRLKEARRLHVIPTSSEKFLSMTIGRLRFIDSMAFMETSLSKWTESLLKDRGPAAFAHLQSVFKEDTKYVLRKGIYPYQYMNHIARYDETELPPREEFEDITEDDYEYAQFIWKHFDIQTIGQFTDLYCRVDVCLLADLFENFRSIGYAEYRIDPAWYVSFPGYSMDCMLKTKPYGAQINCLRDADMYRFFEDFKGGLSMVMNRFAQANHKYMASYDEYMISIFLAYLDMANLYGKAMMLKVPVSNFKWFEIPPEYPNMDATLTEYWTKERILELSEDDEIGYAFEVDIHCPSHLHRMFENYPLYPTNREVHISEFSDTQLDLAPEKFKKTASKLIADLHPKKHYRLHYLELKLGLELGYVLTAVHECIQFNQNAVLKPYIEECARKRALATSDCQKEFHKRGANVIFGKMLMNVRTQRKLKICATELQYDNALKKGNLKHISNIADGVNIVESHKTQFIADQPKQIGFSILSISKYLMYKFYYKTMYPVYGTNMSLLAHDTDGLIMSIRTDDLLSDVLTNPRLNHAFDFTSFPASFACVPMQDKSRDKVPGYMKFESVAKPGEKIEPKHILPIEIAAVRSKCYSVKYADNRFKSTMKGIKRSVQAEQMKHDDYVRCIFEGQQLYVTQTNFVSVKHQIYTVEQRKIALHPMNDKVFMVNRVKAIPYGHVDSFPEERLLGNDHEGGELSDEFVYLRKLDLMGYFFYTNPLTQQSYARPDHFADKYLVDYPVEFRRYYKDETVNHKRRFEEHLENELGPAIYYDEENPVLIKARIAAIEAAYEIYERTRIRFGEFLDERDFLAKNPNWSLLRKLEKPRPEKRRRTVITPVIKQPEIPESVKKELLTITKIAKEFSELLGNARNEIKKYVGAICAGDTIDHPACLQKINELVTTAQDGLTAHWNTPVQDESNAAKFSQLRETTHLAMQEIHDQVAILSCPVIPLEWLEAYARQLYPMERQFKECFKLDRDYKK